MVGGEITKTILTPSTSSLTGRRKTERKLVWTPNYNGINSYIALPSWITSGTFRMSVTAANLPNTSRDYLIGYSSSGNRRYIRVTSGVINIGLGSSSGINTGVSLP